jgi:thiol-disulfide isomerase/thioredoxin
VSKFWWNGIRGLVVIALLAGSSLPLAAQDKVAADESADIQSAEGAETPSLTIGSTAPAISVEHWISDGEGKFKPVEKFEDGKVYVVEFWATWCGPCISSMPHLAELQTTYAEKGVQIISISDEDLETVEGFLKRPVRGARGPKAAKGDSEEDSKEKAPAKPVTYAKLTSAYCLTTDPDGSVKTDYMDAAGQNGIPTSFIVGKSGLIEWIGHPMSMDEPLEKIVSDEWDRDAFLETFRKEQERDLVMAKLRAKMQRGDAEGALEVLAAAKKAAEGDEETQAMYGQLEFRLKATFAMQKIQAGETKEGLADLDELMKTATPAEQQQLKMVKLNAMLSAEMLDEAAGMLTKIADEKETSPEILNQLAWGIYELAQDEEKEVSEPLMKAATAAAEKAVKAEPKNSMLLDTLAHLVHLQGDLDRAIELQTEATANLDEASSDAKKEIEGFLEELKEEKAGK